MSPQIATQPPEGWTEHIEWECLMPKNPFAPERWVGLVGVKVGDRPIGTEPSRTRRVWVGPWQEVQ